jgi:hypothetical protein
VFLVQVERYATEKALPSLDDGVERSAKPRPSTRMRMFSFSDSSLALSLLSLASSQWFFV